MTGIVLPGQTLVAFHAHPDDEALLTAGTLARAVAEGARVVLVVATGGEAGLAARSRSGADLGSVRSAELDASAAALGVHRVVRLGFPDSGSGTPRPGGFATVPVDEAARPLVDVLREEVADVLTVYDPSGGYGHPDHVQVHRVGMRAADLAGTPAVFEATLPREPIRRVVGLLRLLGRILPVPELPDLAAAYTARTDITHRVDVRPFLDAKRAALSAHASQASDDDGVRTLALLLRLPRPLFRLLLGTEYFRRTR